MRFPVDGEATTPMVDARPPHNDSRQAKQRQTRRSEAVHETTRLPRQQVVMKIHKPLDTEPARQLIAKNRDAARDAHQSYVNADYSAHPQVNLENSQAHP